MTDLIVRPRGGGKTTECIRLAAENAAYIVCLDQKRAGEIFRLAEVAGVRIPFPLTADEFFGSRFYRPGCRGFVFDDLDRIIRARAHGVPVLGVTWNAADD